MSEAPLQAAPPLTLADAMPVEEVARLYGVKPSTVLAWARQGTIPALKLPGTKRWLFFRTRIEAHLMGQELAEQNPDRR